MYAQSGGSGTCDSPGTIHQILAAGGLLALCRENMARDCDADGDPAAAARLRSPVLVVGLPANWAALTEVLEGPRRTARIWAFAFSPDGVEYWRSMSLTVKEVLDHLYSYLQ